MLASALILAAVVVGLVSFGWSSFTSHLSLRWLAAITQSSTAVLTLVVLLVLQNAPRSTLAVGCLYILAEIRGCLGGILIAVFLNAGTRQNADKRYFALVNAGAPIAGLTMGLLLGFQATNIQPHVFLSICIGFDLLAWVFLHLTVGGNDQDQSSPLSSAASDVRPPPLRNEVGFGRSLLLLVACNVAVLAFVSYEWKIVAGKFFAVNEQSLTAYFGLFYAISDGLIIVIHIVMAQWALKRRRIIATLFTLPAYLAVVGAFSLFVPGLTVLFVLMTLARGAIVIRRGLHDVVVQVLFGWLPEDSRRESITQVVGMAKPAVEAGVACIILLLSWLAPIDAFAWLWFPVVGVWFFAIFRLLHHWKRISAQPVHDGNEEKNRTG